MPLEFVCPACGQRISLPENLRRRGYEALLALQAARFGVDVECTACGQHFRVHTPSPPAEGDPHAAEDVNHPAADNPG